MTRWSRATPSEPLAARLRGAADAELELILGPSADLGDSFDNGFDNGFDNAFDNS